MKMARFFTDFSVKYFFYKRLIFAKAFFQMLCSK